MSGKRHKQNRKQEKESGLIPWTALAPPPEQSIADWARQNIVLGVRQGTAWPGPFRPERTPYMSGIMEAFQSPEIEQISIMKGSQTGLTLLANICALWAAVNDPGPELFVLPTQALCTVGSKKMMPLISDSPNVLAEIAPGRDTFRTKQYQFKRCSLDWAAAKSQTNLASRTIRYLFVDELGEMSAQKGRESPISAAVERTKTFAGAGRKIVLFSKPTTENDFIHQNFLHGDMRYFNVPCKACGTFQKLEWAQVKFDSKAEPEEAGEGAYYECSNPDCKCHWTDQDKQDAMQKGQWIATNPKVKRHASFHLSALYSPAVTWAGLVKEWLEIQFEDDRRTFINGQLAEVWRGKIEATTMNLVEKAAVDYERDSESADVTATQPIKLPSGDEMTFNQLWEGKVCVNYMTIDVQRDDFWYVVRRWATGGDSALIAWGTLAIDWFELDSIRKRYGCRKALIDSGGDKTSEVYQACQNFNLIAYQGKANVAGHYVIRDTNPHAGMRQPVDGVTIPIIYANADVSKNMLSGLMQNKSKRRWLVYKGIEAEGVYLAHMQSEIKTGGKWKPRSGNAGKQNHLWDCEHMQIVLASVGGFFDIQKPVPENKPAATEPKHDFILA